MCALVPVHLYSNLRDCGYLTAYEDLGPLLRCFVQPSSRHDPSRINDSGPYAIRQMYLEGERYMSLDNQEPPPCRPLMYPSCSLPPNMPIILHTIYQVGLIEQTPPESKGPITRAHRKTRSSNCLPTWSSLYSV